MLMSDNRSRYKRANLFLLRVWCDDADEHEQGEQGERSALILHGKLQRAVSGEAHSFDGRDGLLEVLEAMLCKERPQQRRPRRKTETAAGLPASGNNQTEANQGAR